MSMNHLCSDEPFFFQKTFILDANFTFTSRDEKSTFTFWDEKSTFTSRTLPANDGKHHFGHAVPLQCHYIAMPSHCNAIYVIIIIPVNKLFKHFFQIIY